MPTDPGPFERKRLALFARHGFAGESRWIADGEGRPTYVIARGDGPCPTILVHGGLSQAGEWATFAGRLPGTVVVPDRPGCGLSYPMDYGGTDFRADAVRWMRGLVDGLGARQVDLVGSSMGGYFSITFALHHPDLVRRLVLVGAPAGLDRRLPLFLRMWGNPVAGALMEKLGLLTPTSVAAARKRIFASLLVASPDHVPDDLIETSVDAMSLPGALRGAGSMLRQVTDLGGWRNTMLLRDDMASLTVPTLFIWGDRDAFASPASGREMASRMASAHLETIEDAGHLPHLDRPEPVAEAVVNFLSRGSTVDRGA